MNLSKPTCGLRSFMDFPPKSIGEIHGFNFFPFETLTKKSHQPPRVSLLLWMTDSKKPQDVKAYGKKTMKHGKLEATEYINLLWRWQNFKYPLVKLTAPWLEYSPIFNRKMHRLSSGPAIPASYVRWSRSVYAMGNWPWQPLSFACDPGCLQSRLLGGAQKGWRFFLSSTPFRKMKVLFQHFTSPILQFVFFFSPFSPTKKEGRRNTKKSQNKSWKFMTQPGMLPTWKAPRPLTTVVFWRSAGFWSFESPRFVVVLFWRRETVVMVMG